MHKALAEQPEGYFLKLIDGHHADHQFTKESLVLEKTLVLYVKFLHVISKFHVASSYKLSLHLYICFAFANLMLLL